MDLGCFWLEGHTLLVKIKLSRGIEGEKATCGRRCWEGPIEKKKGRTFSRSKSGRRASVRGSCGSGGGSPFLFEHLCGTWVGRYSQALGRCSVVKSSPRAMLFLLLPLLKVSCVGVISLGSLICMYNLYLYTAYFRGHLIICLQSKLGAK